MANYQAAQAEADADAAKASARVEADRIRKAGSRHPLLWQRQVLRREKERRCALRQELPETLNKMLSRRS
jgi:hypothetical protein